MHTGKRYRLRDLLVWTTRETVFMTVVAVVPTLLSVGLGWRWFEVPWVPVAMLGTASAFTVGFRNNATYARTWEARQIWGGIVNASRSWALMVRDLIPARARGERSSVTEPAAGDASAHEANADARRLVACQIAWLTALRYQLREPRQWENMDRADNVAFQRRYYTIAERDGELPAALVRFLGESDATHVLAQANRATAIVSLQSAYLETLARDGTLDAFRHVAMQGQLTELLDLQGRCERIKNFPYPRQFATLNYWFIRLFVWLVPFGMLQEFRKVGTTAVWLTIPFSVLVTWLFLALEKVGESTENPFEGSANDVPITALSRTIEIDLRQIVGDPDVPTPLTPQNAILL